MPQKIKHILLIIAIVALTVFLVVVGFAIFAVLAVIVAIMTVYRKFKMRRELSEKPAGDYPGQPARKAKIYKKSSVIEAEYEIIDDDK